MILELHCHTSRHSPCSHVSAEDLVQGCFEKGLQGTVITDHHYLWSDEELRRLRSSLRVPDYYVILSGQEVETPELGHMLVYGADVSLDRGTPLDEIRERFPQAALVWAHPYRDQNIPSPDRLLHPLIDGVEMFSTNHTLVENNRGLRDWHQYKYTAIAGTDAHGAGYAGLYPTMFDHPVSTVQELANEIRQGRCRPFFQEIPRAGTSSTRVTEIIIGTKGAGARPDTFVIKAHRNEDKWLAASRSVRILEEIACRGFDAGRFRVPRQFGNDRESLTVIEQGIHGRSLFDAIMRSGPHDARNYLRMAARWLARLHNLGLQITPPDEFLHVEPTRLAFYLSAFYEHEHPHTRRAEEIMNTVLATERALYGDHPEKLVQGHGDYHPKNIFIGRDSDDAPATTFVAAIDFSSSRVLPPAFDVGTFLAQFRNQLYDMKNDEDKVTEDIFLQEYLKAAPRADRDLASQAQLFRARTGLGICYHLIKVGLGDSENLWRVLAEAGQALTRLQIKGMGSAASIEEKKSA